MESSKQGIKVINSLIKRCLLLRFNLYKMCNANSVRSPYGVKLSSNWGDETFRSCAIGVYGKYFSNFLLNQCSEYIFIDIGANQGLYSLVANNVQLCKEVIAFEPVEETFNIFIKNIEINNATKINCYNFAISDREQELDIFIPNNHSGGATLRSIARIDNSGNTESIKTISAARLRSLISDFHRYIVKIDVEGHELIVLSELFKLEISSRFSHIFYEVDERWSDARKLESLLKENGFTKFDHIGSNQVSYDVLASK